MMLRRYGSWKFFTDLKLYNGMIRNNWNVCTFSDRDIARLAAPLGIKPLGIKATNRKFIETCDNFRPDAIFLGHCDTLTNDTLREVKRRHPQTPLIHYNIDALWIESNVAKIHHRKEVVDAIYCTTGGSALVQFRTGKNIVGYIPNAVDPSIDCHDNSIKTEFKRDLMYCGKGDTSDERYPLVVSLHEQLKEKLHFETFGIYGKSEIWGERYEQVITTSKMALNLNRIEGWPLYSSDRIAQLIGNGLLTFVWDKGHMRKILDDRHAVFFKDEDDLTSKILQFHNNDSMRKLVAAAGRAYYHEHFSAQSVVHYMIEMATGKLPSNNYAWE
jgi:hypothetical protein